MCKRTDTLLLLILVGIVIGLLAAFVPLSDIDNDGLLDSSVTEDFLLLTVLLSVTGLFSLLTNLVDAYIVVPWHFSYLIVPPPISL